MLDSIRTLTELPESGDVLVSREDIVAARRRRTLQQQAQRWARGCVEQAQRDAEVIRTLAFEEGYAEGILRVNEHLAHGLLASQSLGMQLRKDLAQAARDLLAQALSRPEWLDDMLERWLTEQTGDKHAVLHVLLPMHCQTLGNEMRECLRVLWPGEMVLDYQPQERYVLRLGDQLLEFDMAATRQLLEPRLLASLANLPDSVRSLDQTSVQALTKLCASFTGHSLDANDEVRDEH
ncbi:MAG: oxygen-regulated invasion protein OrgB [Pseudomonas sp.]|uniref:oxygen-regulated invasion protein OrgB n=1 Tax=Pseudomonas sp. TaxID=306 RepID=UPI003D7005F6